MVHQMRSSSCLGLNTMSIFSTPQLPILVPVFSLVDPNIAAACSKLFTVHDSLESLAGHVSSDVTPGLDMPVA